MDKNTKMFIGIALISLGAYLYYNQSKGTKSFVWNTSEPEKLLYYTGDAGDRMPAFTGDAGDREQV